MNLSIGEAATSAQERERIRIVRLVEQTVISSAAVAEETHVDVLVEELELLLLVLAEAVNEIVDDVVARDVLRPVEATDLGLIRTTRTEHAIFARSRVGGVVREPTVRRCETVFASELMVERIDVRFEVDRTEGRTRAEFRRQVDRTGARVAARGIPRARCDLERTDPVEP